MNSNIALSQGYLNNLLPLPHVLFQQERIKTGEARGIHLQVCSKEVCANIWGRVLFLIGLTKILEYIIQ